MTHDDVRHGTTTPFATLDVLDGTVVARCKQRQQHQEFIRFPNAVETAVPEGLVIHAILDNDATHEHAKVQRWPARHPRWTFHFTPTSCCPRPSPDGRCSSGWIDRPGDDRWLNAVESFFSAMTRRGLRRGVFRSLVDLQAAINGYLDEHNADPRPFTWTATPASLLDKLDRANASVPERIMVGDLTMSTELLEAKIEKLESDRPSAAEGRGHERGRLAYHRSCLRRRPGGCRPDHAPRHLLPLKDLSKVGRRARTRRGGIAATVRSGRYRHALFGARVTAARRTAGGEARDR